MITTKISGRAIPELGSELLLSQSKKSIFLCAVLPCAEGKTI
jgi:hypothetical protein